MNMNMNMNMNMSRTKPLKWPRPAAYINHHAMGEDTLTARPDSRTKNRTKLFTEEQVHRLLEAAAVLAVEAAQLQRVREEVSAMRVTISCVLGTIEVTEQEAADMRSAAMISARVKSAEYAILPPYTLKDCKDYLAGRRGLTPEVTTPKPRTFGDLAEGEFFQRDGSLWRKELFPSGNNARYMGVDGLYFSRHFLDWQEVSEPPAPSRKAT
jgi:hypothetical protein